MRSLILLCSVVALLMSGCRPSSLVLKAPRTTLGVGETVHVAALERGPWLFETHALEPGSLVWRTTGESCLLAEPDGRVTCVGTGGREKESAVISAASGSRRGWLRFRVTRSGPGPSLDLVTQDSLGPCPQWPTERCAVIHEGDSLRFRVRERGPGAPDVTARSMGTRYLVFIGSGLANDPAPEVVVGKPWPQNLNAASVRIDDVHGVITAPETIGELNCLAVIILVRSNDSVGWLFLRIEHRARQWRDPAHPATIPLR